MSTGINWFEIPIADEQRGVAFYSKLYAQELQSHEIGDGSTFYFLPCGGSACGSLIIGEGYTPSQEGTVVYLNAGDDLQVMLDRVAPAGGKVLVEKTHIGEDSGYFAHFLDTEGNRVGLHSTS